MSQIKRYTLSRYGANLLRVNATVGSAYKRDCQRVSLLVDTGASYTILPARVLEDLQYDLKNSSRYQSIITGQGTTAPLPVIGVSWFNCLGQFFDDFDVIAYQLPTRLQVSGLLGMDFLTRCQAVISVARGEIYFE
jgi:aspartyl protease family protein